MVYTWNGGAQTYNLRPPPNMTEDLSREEQFEVLTKWPGLMDEIFRHVAMGGDLITFCEPKNIRYCDLYDWLLDDPARGIRLGQATDAGLEWIKQRILVELKRMGLADLRQIYEPDGSLKDPSVWSDEVAHALVQVEVDVLYEGSGKDRERVGFTQKVKFHDKIKALELWGRELGMFAQKHKHEGSLKLEDLVAGSRKGELNENK